MIKSISYGIIVFINCLFILKYGLRITEYALVLALIYIVSCYFFYIKKNAFLNSKLYENVLTKALVTIPIIFAFISFLKVDLPALNVDRWSVIDNFLTYLFNGDYPYSAESHMGNPPGPMPIYYLIALPFYFFKGYSFLGVLGYAIIGFLSLNSRFDYKNSTTIISILSVFMIYEIMALSNVFTYSVLSALTLAYFESSLKTQKKNILISLLLLGLMLSTRSVYSLVYVVFFLSYLKSGMLSIVKASLYSTIILFFFALTFLPFVLFYGDSFMKINPFIVQSSFLVPQLFVSSFFIIALFFGLLAKNSAQRFFYSGITLFVAICIYAGYHMNQSGVYTAYMGSKIDLTYFVLCVPFLLIASSLGERSSTNVSS